MALLALLSFSLLASAQEPATPASAPKEAPVTVSFTAVGDIRLDGPIGDVIRKKGAPAAGVQGLLEADIVFGNLECPLTKRGTKHPKTWNFRAPAKNLAALQDAGFNVVNIANNHTWDYGLVGFNDTLAALQKYKLRYVGGGKNREEAEGLAVIKKGGLKIGLLGFTSTHPEQAWAGPRKPGVAYSDFKRLTSVIREARARCDVLIVSLHGGTELAEEPNDIQKAFGRMAVDAGADLVIGHHPHVLQAVEIYKGKAIVYSLGNFLFVSPSPATRATAVLRAQLSKNGVDKLTFAPVDVNWGALRPATDDIRQQAYDSLNRLGAFDEHKELVSFLPGAAN